jgi:hypothetical protein
MSLSQQNKLAGFCQRGKRQFSEISAGNLPAQVALEALSFFPIGKKSKPLTAVGKGLLFQNISQRCFVARTGQQVNLIADRPAGGHQFANAVELRFDGDGNVDER